MSDLISVIIPTFNSARFINFSLKSVLSQSYKNFELLIIDDCSSDSTMSIIRKFSRKDKRIKIFKTNKNSGSAAAPRNIGIKYARGKYIAFIDSDDVWHQDKLINQLNDLSKDKFISCTACNYQYGFKGPKSSYILNLLRIIIQFFFIRKINFNGYKWLYIYNPIIMSSVLANKKLFNYYKFNEDKYVREDLDIWLKFSHKFKNTIKFNPRILLTITRREGSSSASKKPEMNKIISSISKDFIFKDDYKYYNFFIFGIILKSAKSFIKTNYIFFTKNLKRMFFFILIIYFSVFYTPLFWLLGKNLIYFDDFKETETLVAFSGHGDIKYLNDEYLKRYTDLKTYLEKNNNVRDIYLVGRYRVIPEQIIIQSLLINNDGYQKKNIKIIYEDFGSTKDNILNMSKILNNANINKITFFTSPYHSKRAKLIWEKNVPNIEVFYFKSNYLPKKNNFFERAYNKKIIIYEHFSIIYNRILRKL